LSHTTLEVSAIGEIFQPLVDSFLLSRFKQCASFEKQAVENIIINIYAFTRQGIKVKVTCTLNSVETDKP